MGAWACNCLLFIPNSFFVMFMTVSMRMRVVVEQEQSQDVHCQTSRSHTQYPFRIGDLWWIEQPLNGFKADGHTQCHQENAIDQRTQCLCGLPAVCKLLGRPRILYMYCPEADA